MTKKNETTNTSIDYDNLSKEDLIKLAKAHEDKIEKLEQSKGQGVKELVMAKLEEGYNTIEEIAEVLEKTSKNISSNLTYLRKDLVESGKTIVSQRINNKTYLAIVETSIFGI